VTTQSTFLLSAPLAAAALCSTAAFCIELGYSPQGEWLTPKEPLGRWPDAEP